MELADPPARNDSRSYDPTGSKLNTQPLPRDDGMCDTLLTYVIATVSLLLFLYNADPTKLLRFFLGYSNIYIY